MKYEMVFVLSVFVSIAVSFFFHWITIRALREYRKDYLWFTKGIHLRCSELEKKLNLLNSVKPSAKIFGHD